MNKNKMDFYKNRFFAFYKYVFETQSEGAKRVLDEDRAIVEEAYNSNNEKLLQALDRELTVGINEYPPECRKKINNRIEAEAGVNTEEVEQKRLKKLQTIIKRGTIKNRADYELVHSRLDELIHNVPKDDPARKDIIKLERIFMHYSISLKSE